MITTVNNWDEVQMDVNKDMDYTWNIKVYGIVQGVGFRPFVKRLGDSCGVKGCGMGPWAVEAEWAWGQH